MESGYKNRNYYPYPIGEISTIMAILSRNHSFTWFNHAASIKEMIKLLQLLRSWVQIPPGPLFPVV